jgi:ketosteroid isomerase-like protein
MKRILVMTALAISSVFLFAQSKDEQAIRQVLNELSVALKAKDVTALNRLWADDYMFISAAGMVFNKAQRAAAISSGTPSEYFAYENVKVRLYGNSAVINSTVKFKNAGQDTALNIASLVMIKNGGRWQVVNGQGSPAATSTADANDQKTVMQIEQDMTAALLKGDVSVNERYQTDDFIFTAPNATVMNKAQGIADIKSGDLKFESSKIEDMKVLVVGNTAVATYRTTDKGKYKDQDLSGEYRWTDTFVKQNGRWQLIAGQGTPIPKK